MTAQSAEQRRFKMTFTIDTENTRQNRLLYLVKN